MNKKFLKIYRSIDDYVDWSKVAKNLNITRQTVYTYRRGNIRSGIMARAIADEATRLFVSENEKRIAIQNKLSTVMAQKNG